MSTPAKFPVLVLRERTPTPLYEVYDTRDEFLIYVDEFRDDFDDETEDTWDSECRRVLVRDAAAQLRDRRCPVIVRSSELSERDYVVQLACEVAEAASVARPETIPDPIAFMRMLLQRTPACRMTWGQRWRRWLARD